MIDIFFRSARWVGLLVLLAASLAVAQRGALTAPRNLSQITTRSAVIVRGRVIDAHVESHPTYRNLHTLVVTLRSDEVLKGQVPATYTFRQVIWDIRDINDNAGYRKGQQWLLFLNPVNENGLTSPVGMEQGRFRVTTVADGKLEVLNGRGNVGLFEGVSEKPVYQSAKLSAQTRSMVQSHVQGPVLLDQLREVVRALAGGR
jgi:hypothetical protein